MASFAASEQTKRKSRKVWRKRVVEEEVRSTGGRCLASPALTSPPLPHPLQVYENQRFQPFIGWGR